MRNTINNRVVALLAVLSLAACSSGDGSAPGSRGPLDNGGPGVALASFQDNSGEADFSAPLSINDFGEIAGYAKTADGSPLRAALWQVTGSETEGIAPLPLYPLAGNQFSAAFAVDENGNAVGISGDGDTFTAVCWRAGSDQPTALPKLAAGKKSAAYGISPDGSMIVGEAVDAASRARAVLWRIAADGTVGAPIPLPVGKFIRSGEPSIYSVASAVNDAGWVVGEVEDGAEVTSAVLWRPNGAGGFSTIDLRRSGDIRGRAIALDAAGQITCEVEASAGVYLSIILAENADGRFKEIPRTRAQSELSLQGAQEIYSRNIVNLAVGRRGTLGFVQQIAE